MLLLHVATATTYSVWNRHAAGPKIFLFACLNEMHSGTFRDLALVYKRISTTDSDESKMLRIESCFLRVGFVKIGCSEVLARLGGNSSASLRVRYEPIT